MIRLSKMTDYAIVMLSYIASSDSDKFSAAHLSDATSIPVPTVAKLLKTLTKADILTSFRGITGGYSLSADSSNIKIAHIVEAIEGPIALTACVDETQPSCKIRGNCSIHGNWTKVNEAVKQALLSVSLQDMASTSPAHCHKLSSLEQQLSI